MNILKNLMGTAAAALMLMTLAPTAANAVVMGGVDRTFTFSGLCDDCTSGTPGDLDGTYAPVTGTLMLTDFIAGTLLDDDNFVSFTYDGSTIIPGGFTVNAGTDVHLTGTLDDAGNVETVFVLTWQAPLISGLCFSGDENCFFVISPNASRNWQIGGTTPEDIGINGTFASVPEPGALALFGLGLAGLGFARRRKVA